MMRVFILLIGILIGFSASVGAVEQSPLDAEIPREFLQRRIRQPIAEIRISVPEVLKLQGKGSEIILVDVRKSKNFEVFRIPGTINIPLYLVKTKTFLKSKFVVLCNEGYANAALEEEQKRLGDSGFANVAILDGGLNAWRQAGAPLAGDQFTIEQLTDVSPQTFFAERHFSNWRVIDISTHHESAKDGFLPDSLAIPFARASRGFITQIRQHLGAPGEKPLPLVLIVNETGEYGKIKRLLNQSGLKNIYYLQGGLQGYRNFLRRQALLRHPLKMKSGSEVCQSCPEAN